MENTQLAYSQVDSSSLNSGPGNSGPGNLGPGNLGSGNLGSGNLGSGNPGSGNPGSVNLVSVEELTKLFPLTKSLFRSASSFIHAVDGVSFDLKSGESFGLVGESGCGKTTVGKLTTKLLEPTAGRVLFRDEDGTLLEVSQMKKGALKTFRRRVQMIFQDPYESLNPRRNVYDTVAEPLVVQGIGSSTDRMDRVTRLLDMVGLTPASYMLFRYPHELSGGQRQRVAIARALAIGPSFVVADEPTSMLDVSISSSIIHLMLSLAQQLEITYLYITHDLAVARHMCTRIAVMYLGKIVEVAETEELLRNPIHPYTKALLSAVPNPDPSYRRGPVNIHGELTRPIDPPEGCRFFDRCPMAAEVCRASPHPPLLDQGGGHLAACYRV